MRISSGQKTRELVHKAKHKGGTDSRLYRRDHKGVFRDASHFADYRAHGGAAPILTQRSKPPSFDPVKGLAHTAARVGHTFATAQGKQRRYEWIRDTTRHMVQDGGWDYEQAKRQATLAYDQKLRKLRSK